MIGETVSHYKIIEKLGGGGMGVVYRAKDLKLDRSVALKFLPPELTRDPDAKRRFVNEAKAASALQHNNICTIHAIDETPDGRLFICMDCYQGETLKKKIARGPLAVDEAIAIVIQVAEGLAKAHEAGMVHRDVKPANIMVTRDGVAKVLDFGIAKLAGTTKLTKTGMTVGTVAYLSPEQARGKEVDARSDVYSLGVVLYELLTCHVPFEGDHETVVLYKIIHEDPEPVSKYREDIPEGLLLILETALRKDAHERYPSSLDLKAALEELGNGSDRKRRKRPRTVGRRVLGLWRRREMAIVIVVTLLIAVAWFFQWSHRQVAPGGDMALAVVDFRDLGSPDDFASSAAVTGLVHVGLVENSPCRVVSSEYLYDLRRRLFGAGRGLIEADQALEVARTSGAKMLLSGQMATVGSAPYVTWQLMDTHSGNSLGAGRIAGENPAHLADQIITDVLPLLVRECEGAIPVQPSRVSALTTESPEAYRHYVLGMLAGEDGQNIEAVRELKRAVELDSTFASALFELGRLHFHVLGAQDRAREYAEAAWALRARLGIRDHMRLQAWRKQMEGRVGEALTTYREMRARWPDDREILSDLSGVLFWWWCFDEVAEVAGQALDLYPDDYDFGYMCNFALLYSGRPEAALDVARTNIERHPESPRARDDLGWVYLALSEPDSAEAAFRQALEIDPNYLWPQLGIGSSYYCRGDLTRAIENHQQILRRTGLLPHERVQVLSERSLFLSLSVLYAETGRFKEALRLLEEARNDITGPAGVRRLEDNRNELLIRMGRALEVLHWAQDLEEPADAPVAQFRGVSYRGRAWVALDSLEAAQSCLGKLRALEDHVGSVARATRFEIDAKIALAEGKPEKALECLNEMRRHGLPSGGLHDIEHREIVARAQRMAGRFKEAIATHRELLRIYGGHALSHCELGQIYEEMGRPVDAAQEYAAFLEMWSQADEGLPQLEDTRARLAKLRADS